ncbi:MAG: hypothetical protein HFF69_02595 [Oscillospiraceae bacterium]|jgi:hypothetical protein|nr:hypothetical protein [Oscillospiraceae bacterium]
MERLPLTCQNGERGELTVCPQGARTELRASMPDPGDGLYRAFLLGERGELALGVLAPEGGRLELCRRVYSRDTAALGPLLRGEARRSFRFQDAPPAPQPESGCWHETHCPAQLFQSRFLQNRLRPVGRAWWRREGALLALALPLEEGRPFPLEALFCLGRVRQVEGTRCVVYAFREEEPVL